MPIQTSFARHLRSIQSDSEKLLWSRLRSRRLAGWKFKRQVPFAQYVADFVCADGKLVVELDGASHTWPEADVHDFNRTEIIKAFGYQVIRFWNDEVMRNTDGVCETILAELEHRR